MPTYTKNHGKWGSQAWNGQANLATIPGDVVVLYNQRQVSLFWGTQPGTEWYQLQVSLFPDFRSTIININLQESNYTFTDSAGDNSKRWWRWRPSVTAGANFLAPWSQVGSYWMNTGAAEQIQVPENYWVIFDPNSVGDIYFFDLAPQFQIVPKNIWRFQGRNRVGILLSEFLTVKEDIVLQFEGGQYIIHSQMDEFERFNNTKRTFFLANYAIWKHGEPIPNIWLVECTEDPAFMMIAAGRPDQVRGSVKLTEV